MRLRKRIISIIMTIVLVIGTVFGGGVIPANAAGTSLKAGSIFTSGKYRYKVVSVSKKSGTVSLIGAKSKKLVLIEMPDTVKKNGCTFKVTEIGNNAFKGYKKLKSVDTNKELKVIGKNAFKDCKKLSEIDIVSTKLEKVGKNALKGIHSEAVIEVPEGKESTYSKLLKVEIKNNDASIQSEHTHSFDVTETIKAATCTENGLQRMICSTCGVVEKLEFPALGHQYAANSTVDRAATCTKEGLQSRHCVRCGAKTDVEIIPATGHSFTQYVSDDNATCKKDGTETAECDNCGVTRTRTVTGSKLSHKMGDWKETTAATCTAAGEETRTCSQCGYKETREIPALGHVVESVEEIPATCTQPGQRSYNSTCSRCGHTVKPEEIPALGHSFTNYVYNEDATCEKDGTETAKCDRCGATDTRISVGSALGHSFSDYKANNDATCEKDGTETAKCDRCDATNTREMSGTKKPHSFSGWVVKTAATCTTTGTKERVCAECSAVETETIEALGHDMKDVEKVDATCETPGKITRGGRCSRCGYAAPASVIPALGHSYTHYVYNNDATCEKDGTETAKCDRCQKQVTRTKAGTKKAHDMGEWTVKTSATCQNEGIEVRTCKVCGSGETRKTAVADHTYGDWNITRQASCTAPGRQERVCTVCGKKEVQSIPVLEHKLVPTKLQEATCNDYGKQYSECEVCGQVFFRIVAQPTGHNWEEVTVEPTCTTKGYTATECTRCHEKKDIVDEIKALGHDFSGEWVIDEEPTCVTVGHKSVKCLRCDQKKTATIPSNGGHKYEVIATTDATCTAMGTETEVCEYCGDTKKIPTTPAIGHDFDVEKIVVEPTCEKSGVATVKCNTCGYEKTQYTIPATGHQWDGDVHVYNAEEVALTSLSLASDPGVKETGKVVGDDEVNDNCSFKFVYHECEKDGCTAKKLINIQAGNGHNWSINEEQTTATCTNSGRWQHYYGNNNYGNVENSCPINRWIKNRLVWAVVAKVDNPERVKLGSGWITYGGNDEYAAIVKTTIMSTGDGGQVESYNVDRQNKITITAPEPAEGYRFVGWKDLQTKEMLEQDSKTITFTWKDMGRMYEAVYESVGK